MAIPIPNPVTTKKDAQAIVDVVNSRRVSKVVPTIQTASPRIMYGTYGQVSVPNVARQDL